MTTHYLSGNAYTACGQSRSGRDVRATLRDVDCADCIAATKPNPRSLPIVSNPSVLGMPIVSDPSMPDGVFKIVADHDVPPVSLSAGTGVLTGDDPSDVFPLMQLVGTRYSAWRMAEEIARRYNAHAPLVAALENLLRLNAARMADGSECFCGVVSHDSPARQSICAVGHARQTYDEAAR